LLLEPFLDNVVLCGPLLAAHGSAEQRALVSSMIEGRMLFALAAAESGSRYDLFDVATSITRTAEGLILEGDKHLVACGDSADYLLVLAQEKGPGGLGGESGQDGLTLVLVPRQAEGVRTRGYRTYDGRHCVDVAFDQVRLPASAVVGAPGEAWPLVEAACDRAHVALAAEAAGVMQTLLDMTVEYSRTRKQFGRPIGANQVYQHRLVDVYVHVEEMRSLAMHATTMLEEERSIRARWASAAKAYACVAGRKVGEEGVQLHGAIGMTEEYAAGGLYKRLAAIANQYGDAEWHYARIRDLADAQAVHEEA
jgi:butyryl-CoA dehydrogenase